VKKYKITIFYNKKTVEYFLSIFSRQPNIPSFEHTTFALPHVHGTYGPVRNEVDLVQAYYGHKLPQPQRVCNPIRDCEPEQTAGFTDKEKATVSLLLEDAPGATYDLNDQSFARVAEVVGKIQGIMAAIAMRL
jgi:hypothetical protein